MCVYVRDFEGGVRVYGVAGAPRLRLRGLPMFKTRGWGKDLGVFIRWCVAGNGIGVKAPITTAAAAKRHDGHTLWDLILTSQATDMTKRSLATTTVASDDAIWLVVAHTANPMRERQ